MNRVVLTGTGVPVPDPGRAGAGALVDIDGVRLQVERPESPLVKAELLQLLHGTHPQPVVRAQR